MEVRLGQWKIVNSEREGGNERWCGSFLHHPFSFGHPPLYPPIDREDKDGKNGVFEEEEEEEEEEEAPNTLLTLSSSEMYSSNFISQRETFLRKGS